MVIVSHVGVRDLAKLARPCVAAAPVWVINILVKVNVRVRARIRVRV